jgi:hypothetical protein
VDGGPSRKAGERIRVCTEVLSQVVGVPDGWSKVTNDSEPQASFRRLSHDPCQQVLGLLQGPGLGGVLCVGCARGCPRDRRPSPIDRVREPLTEVKSIPRVLIQAGLLQEARYPADCAASIMRRVSA